MTGMARPVDYYPERGGYATGGSAILGALPLSGISCPVRAKALSVMQHP